MITIIKLLEISLSIIGSQFNRIQFNLYKKKINQITATRYIHLQAHIENIEIKILLLI